MDAGESIGGRPEWNVSSWRGESSGRAHDFGGHEDCVLSNRRLLEGERVDLFQWLITMSSWTG